MINYTRQDLIRDVLRKYGVNDNNFIMFPKRPTRQYNQCARCRHETVRIIEQRYGDGGTLYVNWVADVYAGVCQWKYCGYLNLWIELISSQELDQENHRLFNELCDRVLNLL